MTLAAELFGAFVAGLCSSVVILAAFGPRFVRWYMKRKLGGMMNLTGASMKMKTATEESDKPLYSTVPPGQVYSTKPPLTLDP